MITESMVPYMRPSETRELLDRAVSFPVDHDTLVQRIGYRTIEAPNGDGESLSDILERTGSESYQSPDDVYNAIMGNLGDAYIGRKYYDDRGPNHHEFDNISL